MHKKSIGCLSNLARNFNQMAERINLYISKLKEKEIELALKIQRSLLPDEKEFSLFREVKYYFLPSRGIKGDYFEKYFNEKEFFFQKLLEDIEEIFGCKNPIDDLTILFIKL